ncbi:flagellar P-ring protein precursor FlgI [Duganella sacchari]|uniref:Flagellar P-ring protein n=1 Tax=Duganella sacchari TaxID=551987 RepID=A0A1M7PLL8_9BURK|nr:flagellar basal body P-ring protein FlgI [Duganella sacchari]SHN18099.1 flagellar P-ring protein precursor FlgI [Duganella sacchari]
MRALHALTLAALLAVAGVAGAAVPKDVRNSGEAIRVKDLGHVQGWRDNALIGYGIVTGLAGSGDSANNRVTRQALANALTQFNLSVPPEQVQSRNVAVVLVAATLAPFSREGDALDITVTSAGDARSLVGGSLLQTPLKGANGRVYALAQGQLSVGGYRYDANGNVVQKNHATSASVPGGAIVEVGVDASVLRPDQRVTFVLSEADYTTAARVASAINSQFGATLAHAHDAAGIDIAVPEAQRAGLVEFLAQVENVMVEPDRRARVVINERTGTLVAGGDVRIARVAISQGDLKLTISSENSASQPYFIGNAGAGVRTAIVTNTRVEVDEPNGAGFVNGSGTVGDLVQALAKLKTSTRDVISILRAIKAAGALHAELIVQ